MKPIPLTLQTLYADLVQQAHAAPVEAGSVYTQTIKGIDYLYVRTHCWIDSGEIAFLGALMIPMSHARAESGTARSEGRRRATKHRAHPERSRGCRHQRSSSAACSTHWPMPGCSRQQFLSAPLPINAIRRSWERCLPSAALDDTRCRPRDGVPGISRRGRGRDARNDSERGPTRHSPPIPGFDHRGTAQSDSGAHRGSWSIC